MAATSDLLLRGSGLGRRIGDGWIWRDLSLELRAGARAVLVGPSGSGKSLLLRALCGLDAVDAGAIELLGRPLEAWSPPAARATALWVGQKPFVDRGSVWDAIRLPSAFAANAGRAIDRDGTVAILEALGRDASFLDADVTTLSGGEEQLVALTRALLVQPRVLLLDEPTAHLDDATARRVEQLVAEWVGGGDRAALWTSHDADRVARVADGPRITLERPLRAPSGAAP